MFVCVCLMISKQGINGKILMGELLHSFLLLPLPGAEMTKYALKVQLMWFYEFENHRAPF